MREKFTFDGWRFDAASRVLSRGESRERLTPKSAATLRVLLSLPHEVASREHLLSTVWPDSPAADEVLTHAIRELRRALGDAPRSPRYIETVPKLGFRFRG